MSKAAKRAVAAAVLASGLWSYGAGVAPAQVEPAKTVQPQKDYREEFHPALMGEAKQVPGLVLYGPDGAECVKFEAAGLHISLPPGYVNQRPGTGVITDFGARGDFEITVSFEIPHGKDLGPPANYSNLRVVIVPNEPAQAEVWHKASQNRAGLVREIIRKGGAGRFFANATKWNPEIPRDKWNNEDFSNAEHHDNKRSPTEALTGRLRLVRSGTNLFFFTSEEADKDFKLLHKSEFGAKDLKNIRVLASTGTARDAIDILVTDLHIRADALVKEAATVPAPPAAEARSPATTITIVLATLGVLGLLAPLGVWLYLRKRRAAAPANPAPAQADKVVIACSHCGKKFKIKSERAGKAIKCPQCGKAVKVPAAAPPNDAEEES